MPSATSSGSCNDAASVVNALLGFGSVVADAPLASLDFKALQLLLDAGRNSQRLIDMFLVRVGVAAAAFATPADASASAKKQAMSEFLQGRSGQVRASTARRDARRVEVASQLPNLQEAIETGGIGSDQLDSITLAAQDLTPTQRRQLDTAETAHGAELLPADVFDRKIREDARRIKGDDGLTDAKEKRKRSRVRFWFDEKSGMGRFSGKLDPERFESLTNAVDQRAAAMAKAGGVEKNEHLAADALVDLVTGASGRGRRLPHITLVVDERTARSGPHPGSTTQTGNGHHVPPETVARHFCDSIVQRVVLDERGVPIDVGRSYRTATAHQWSALRSLYFTCAWDGCDAPLSWCQAHHLHEWGDGGATDLCNLIPLCSRHHHYVHEGQWTAKLLPDRSFKIYRPDGTHHATTWPDRLPGRQPSYAGADG